ncbi:flagellar protein FlaG [Neobacillus ginsengisoli]|uniref:Flagellar protein FlaG n=1 Tax=Neobacillus ginsengisoli TaxID=904295 RepID=A0ABT9XVG6_9BACI|nr:flagellar protein FlaG [Neobacillus ginsengisoli]MDQ0199562.1 flagellar protein FlaG [Neobacillus ginsengisoli]
MEISKIPSIQNQTASDQRQNNPTRDQTPIKRRSEQTDKQIQDSVRQLNIMAEQSQVFLEFKLHDKSGEYYVKMIDSKTNEVIREIPSKKMLDYFSEMKKFLGLLVDKNI